MAKEIKIKLIDSKELIFQIEEDAQKGDYFNIKEAFDVDYSELIKAIEEGKNDEYKRLVENEKQNWESQIELNPKFKQVKDLLSQFEKRNELLQQQIEQIKSDSKKNEELLKSNHQNEVSAKTTNLKESYEQTINQLRSEAELLKVELQNTKENLELQIQNKVSEKEKQIQDKYLQSIEKEKEKISNLEKEKEKELGALKVQITELQKNQENAELQVEKKYLNLLADEKQKVTQLKSEQEALKLKYEKEVQIELEKTKNTYEEKILEKEKAIAKLENANQELLTKKTYLSTKQLGNSFEDAVYQTLRDSFGYSQTIKIEKAKMVADEDGKKTAADFSIEIYENADSKEPIAKIAVEAKTKQENSTTNIKNEDHLKKLEKDRQKSKSDYAILVSELDFKEGNFYINNPRDYKNIYICSLDLIVPVVGLLINISQKTHSIKASETRIEEKVKILSKFEDLREYLAKHMEAINKSLNDMRASAEAIQKSAQKIKDNADKIQDKEFRLMNNKVDGFKIETQVKKLEKLGAFESSDPKQLQHVIEVNPEEFSEYNEKDEE
ncbi:DUF2130 domain-containing protein [Mycoplasmopsis gallinacea]|uniref:DUF2130 domain-containing protein n=1 Tax=Mycoplasmopsis gallinacea TaxID=29556 RepID=A0A6H0V569_9BACT|nr:DUF2130 domain-containing protein [Mycoplasmopsis gallinacea]QIW62123.1 DUF2130 domain-containing protein [Mycoplasmopsis gallinacea]